MENILPEACDIKMRELTQIREVCEFRSDFKEVIFVVAYGSGANHPLPLTSSYVVVVSRNKPGNKCVKPRKYNNLGLENIIPETRDIKMREQTQIREVCEFKSDFKEVTFVVAYGSGANNPLPLSSSYVVVISRNNPGNICKKPRN